MPAIKKAMAGERCAQCSHLFSASVLWAASARLCTAPLAAAGALAGLIALIAVLAPLAT